MERPIRLVHTSDVHIGDEYDPEKRLNGLRRVVDVSIESNADVLLVVGDLFDSARVKGAEVDAALQQLGRLLVPIVITSGNHDCLDEISIYNRVALSEVGKHVHFIDDPEGGYVIFDSLGLTIWARGLVDHHPGHRPVSGYRPHTDGHWQVAMAHGHYVEEGEVSDRSSPILQSEVAGLGCDYLALGHWHRFVDVSEGGVAASYPGSPSEAGGSFASANLVTFTPGSGVKVERLPL